MKYLEKLLQEEAVVQGEVIQVGGFLNHRLEVGLLRAIGEEFARKFADARVTQILTVESSGIGIAVATAMAMGDLPVIFAKKRPSQNLTGICLTYDVLSVTQKKEYTMYVEKRYLDENDVVLIVDDFISNGVACEGLADMVGRSGAKLAGVGIVIEKKFKGGGNRLRAAGVRVESLAAVERIDHGEMVFSD